VRKARIILSYLASISVSLNTTYDTYAKGTGSTTEQHFSILCSLLRRLSSKLEVSRSKWKKKGNGFCLKVVNHKFLLLSYVAKAP